MYKLEYLPVARKDILDIARYISQDLNNPTAAEELITTIVEKLEKLTELPYITPSYNPIRPLNNEYRRLMVKNYTAFYYVDERTKVITVARVIYSKRDFDKINKYRNIKQKNEEKRLQYPTTFDIMQASNLSERSKCL